MEGGIFAKQELLANLKSKSIYRYKKITLAKILDILIEDFSEKESLKNL